jgi:hypothetical protein
MIIFEFYWMVSLLMWGRPRGKLTRTGVQLESFFLSRIMGWIASPKEAELADPVASTGFGGATMDGADGTPHEYLPRRALTLANSTNFS